jgi:hypothetical protein
MTTGKATKKTMTAPTAPAVFCAGRGTTTLPLPNGSTRMSTCCAWGGGGAADTCCSATVPQKRQVTKPCAFGASSGAEQVGQTKACGTFMPCTLAAR